MSLGVLNPAGAGALAAVAVLVALWLRGRRRRVVPVATLFLWERVPATALDRQRFRPDPLFLAQLGLLLALIGGYVRPYLAEPALASGGVRLLVVLDASASMQAREDRATRFELARGRTRALVTQLLTGDEVMLVTAADRTHVLLRWTADRARALDRLEAVEPVDTPTDLAPALELALGELGARAETRVVVFTDLPREESGVAVGRLAAVDWVQIGRTDDNVAIAGLDVEQTPFRPASEASATVLVRSYAHAARRVVLEARVGDREWTRRELVLPARGAAHVLLTDPPAAGALTVALVGGDALPVDDRAVGWIAAADPLDVVVVTAAPALAATLGGLAATVPGSRVRTVEPAAWDAAPDIDARAVVLDGVAPAAPLPIPALWIAPPTGNDVCPTARAVEDAAVVDWEADHPAVRGLGALEAIALPGTAELATPPWGDAVVLAATEHGAFPFLVAGERDGKRTACLGAAPLGSSDDLPLLLLTLRTLAWLEEPPGAAPLAVHTGVALPVAGDPPVVVAERAGAQRVGERLVLANLFDDRESDIGRGGGGEWPATTRPAVAVLPVGGRHEVGWWIYVAAASLLVLEWTLWVRRA
jgi:hypothetical protein